MVFCKHFLGILAKFEKKFNNLSLKTQISNGTFLARPEFQNPRTQCTQWHGGQKNDNVDKIKSI